MGIRLALHPIADLATEQRWCRVNGTFGEDADLASELTVVSDADIAVLRLNTPYEKRKGLLEGFFRAGDLDFKGKEKKHILDVMSHVPTVVDIYLERPAVIPEIAEQSAAILVNFGTSDEAVLDVIFGKFIPQGKLPFELLASMEAVRRHDLRPIQIKDNPNVASTR